MSSPDGLVSGSYKSIAREANATPHQDEHPADSLEQERPRNRPVIFAAALALIGLALGSLGLALLNRTPCMVEPTEFETKIAAATGDLGPLERQLKMVSPQEATIIVANAVSAGTAAASAAKHIVDTLQLEQDVRDHKLDWRFKDKQRARCSLEIVSAVQSWFKVGANIKSAAATCKPSRHIENNPEAETIRELVCAINIQIVTSSFLSIAGRLASAAASCSNAVDDENSLNPQERINSQCAASVTSMVEALNLLATAAEIAGAGCHYAIKGMSKKTLLDLTGGTGSVASFGAADHAELSSQPAAPEADAAAATARRLFLGGGVEANMILCVTDATTIALQLAYFALNLDDAITVNCPPDSFKGLTALVLPKDIQDDYHSANQALCSIDVNSLLYNIGAIGVFVSLANLQCSNKVNLKAICSTGITGIEGALAGLGAAGSAMHLACDVGQQGQLKNNFTAQRVVQASQNAALAAAQKPIDSYCGGSFSAQCLLAFNEFLSPCPGGTVSKSCPQLPSNTTCPGIGDASVPANDCANQYKAFLPLAIAAQAPWPPVPGSGGFNASVIALNACYQYLSCFYQQDGSPRRLQADEKEKLVLGNMEAMRKKLSSDLSSYDPESRGFAASDAIWDKILEKPYLRDLIEGPGEEDEVWQNVSVLSARIVRPDGSVNDDKEALKLLIQASEQLSERREKARQSGTCRA